MDLTLTLTEDQCRRLADAALAKGMTPETYICAWVDTLNVPTRVLFAPGISLEVPETFVTRLKEPLRESDPVRCDSRLIDTIRALREAYGLGLQAALDIAKEIRNEALRDKCVS